MTRRWIIEVSSQSLCSLKTRLHHSREKKALACWFRYVKKAPSPTHSSWNKKGNN